MDYDDSNKGKSASILEVDRFHHLNRIISRESSAGQSWRIYYRNVNDPEGVPFKWEVQPGTPKNPPREEVIPPPSPPPALQSLWLPNPNCADQYSPNDSKHSVSKLLFWKKHKKRVVLHDLKAQMPGDMKYGHFEFGDWDGEFTGSVQDSRDSASSTNSSNGHSSLRLQSRFGREYDNVVDKPFGCSPWNVMTELRDRVARLV